MSTSTGLGGPRALCCAVLLAEAPGAASAAAGGVAAFSRVRRWGGGDSLPLKAALVPVVLPVGGVGFDGLPDLLGGVKASLRCLPVAAFSGGGERAWRGDLAVWLLLPGGTATGFLAGGGAGRRPCCVAGGFLLLGVVVLVLVVVVVLQRRGHGGRGAGGLLTLMQGFGGREAGGLLTLMQGFGGREAGGLLTLVQGFGGRACSGGRDQAGDAGGLRDLRGWGGRGGGAEGGSSTEPN